MSFPYIFESNFEQGTTTGDWDSETDSASQLDVVSYRQLAALGYRTAAPFQGAYCMRVALTGGTADAFVKEGDIDIAANTGRYVRFAMWISPDFTGTANDTINIFEAQDTSDVVEATFGLRIVAATNVINFGIGETAPTSFGSAEIERGVWYNIELFIDLDNAGANDGTVDLYVTRDRESASTTVHASQVASLDQGAVTHGVLGVQDQLATTTGTILFDNFVFDDTRIYPEKRYREEITLTKSGHVFVGPGDISGLGLLTNGSGDTVRLFDTDQADTNSAQQFKVELVTGINTSVEGPIHFASGCYAQLSGTNPRVQIYLVRNTNEPGSRGPLYYSDGAVRRLGRGV